MELRDCQRMLQEQKVVAPSLHNLVCIRTCETSGLESGVPLCDARWVVIDGGVSLGADAAAGPCR